MRYFRLLILGIFSTVIALNTGVLRAIVAVFLCSSLGFCSFAIDENLSMIDHPNAVQAATPFSLEGQEIAIPPIIREAPIDFQDSLADDFVVSRQTPYSSGRNEVLVVSPSTGTEQRFEISLPMSAGDFRLYKASFDKVVIDDPTRLVGSETSYDSARIQSDLESFSISFDSDNLPSSVSLADGTRAEISGSEAVIFSADGQLIETISLSTRFLNNDRVALEKSSDRYFAQRVPPLVPSHICVNGIRDKIYNSGQGLGNISNALKETNTIYGVMFAWATAYGKRGLEDSLVTGTRNQTLQEIACNRPVECDEPQPYEGQSEIRTDLFRLSGGTNQQVSIRYEFYDIPDRMEIYAEGRLIKSIPDGSGYTDGSSTIPLSIEDGVSFLGIKLIGNEDSGTKWNYTISCSGQSPCPNTNYFQLSQHPYLYSTADPFVSPRPIENTSAFGSSYHHYLVETPICSTSRSGCTTQNVFRSMTSQRRFMAPAEENEFNPVVHCSVTDLQGPGFVGAVLSLRYSDNIINVVDANTFTAINYTLNPPGAGNTHIFHPGRVIRTVIEQNGSIVVRTEGEGTGQLAGANEKKGRELFESIDLEFRSYFNTQNW